MADFLTRHPWNEPLAKISELNSAFNIPLVTPMIGGPLFPGSGILQEAFQDGIELVRRLPERGVA
jgi:hypothetical protein